MVLHGFGRSVRGWLVVPVVVTLALPQSIGAQAPGQPATPNAAFDQLERDLSGKAGQMEGTTDPNGNGVGLAVKESLVLIRDMYTRSLTAYRERLAALDKAPDAEKEKIIAQLRADAAAVQDAYSHFNSYGVNAFNPGVPENSMGAEKGNYQNTLARADEAEKAGNAAAADAIRKQASGMRWAIYMKYREDFLKSLDRNPLLGSYIPGLAVDGDYLFSILQNTVEHLASNAEVRPLFDQHLAAAIKQMDDEIARVNGFTTVTQFWEFGGPRYSRAQDAAAGIAVAAGGDLATQLVVMLQAVHSGYSITKDEKDAVKNAWMDLGLGVVGAVTMFVPVVGPIVAAGITSVQIYRDGDNYVVALVENSQVQSAAPVLGYLKTIDSEDKLADARTKVIMTVGMAIMEYPGLKDALQQGKQGLVKVIRRTAPATAESGVSGVTTATREANTVAGGVSAVTSAAPAAKLLPDVERGIELARTAGIADAETAIGLARTSGAASPDMQRALAGVGHLDDVVKTARLAGVPEAEIQAALARARAANSVNAWGVGVKRDLALAEIRVRGGVLVAPPEDVQELKDFFSGAKPGMSITTKAGEDFASIAAKMRLAARGVPGIAFTENELRLIRQHILPSGAGVTKLYGFDLETHDFFQFFDKQFLQDTEAVFGFRMGSESVGLMGGAPVDVMSLRPDQVSRLTDAQFRQITPKLFEALPEDLKTAVMQEALRRSQAAQSAARTVQGALGVGANGTPVIAVGSGGRLTDEQFKLMSHLNPQQLATMPPEVQNAFMQDALRRLEAQQAADAVRGVSGSSLGRSPLPSVQAPPKAGAAAPTEGTMRLTPVNTASGDAKIFNKFGRLGPGEVNVTGFKPDQITALTNGELGSISVEQLNALSPELKAAVQREVIGRIRKEAAAAGTVITNGAAALNSGSSVLPSNAVGGRATASTDVASPVAATPKIIGKDVRPGDQVALQGLVRENIRDGGGNPDAWSLKTTGDGTPVRNADGSQTYLGPKGQSLKVNFKDGGVSIEGSTAAGPANSVGGAATPADAGTAAAGGTFVPAAAPYGDDFNYGSDAADYISPKIEDLIDARKENQNDYGRDQKGADGSVTRMSKDGKTKIVGRARNGKITLYRFILKTDATAATNTAGSATNTTRVLGKDVRPGDQVMLQGIVREDIRAHGGNPAQWSLKTTPDGSAAMGPDFSQTYIGPNGQTLKVSFKDGGISITPGAVTAATNTAGGAAPDPVTPAPYLGPTPTPNTIPDLGAGTSAELEDAITKAGADPDTVTMSDSGDIVSGKTADGKTTITAIRHRDGSFTVSKHDNAPTPGGGTAAPGPVNTVGAGVAIAGGTMDTGAICGNGDTACVNESDCGGDCVAMTRGCESDGTCQPATNVDLVHQLMFSAASTAMSAFSGDNDDHARNQPEPHRLRAWRAIPRAVVVWMRGSRRFANRSTPTELAPGTLIAIESPQSRSDAKTPQPSVALVATGSSTGDAFRLRVLDPTGKVRKVAMPEGMVLQPIKQPGSTSPAPLASAPRATPLGAFCLEFAKLPPSPGMLYQVAPEALQQKFKALRPVLQAVTRLQQLGLLHPDSNPKTYADSIKQYALWARIDHWDVKKFEGSLVEMTKKNVAALKQNWTQTMETAIRGAAPGRWRDIQAVLQQADALGAGSAR